MYLSPFTAPPQNEAQGQNQGYRSAETRPLLSGAMLPVSFLSSFNVCSLHHTPKKVFKYSVPFDLMIIM